MAVAVHTKGILFQGNANGVTLTNPGVSDGDFLIFVYVCEGGQSLAGMTVPGSTSAVYSVLVGSTAVAIKVISKWASSEGANWAFTSSTNCDQAAAVIAFSGVDPTTPIPVAATSTNSTTASTSHPAPSQAGIVDGMLVTIHAAGTQSVATRSYTPPSGMTEQVDAAGSGWIGLEVNTLATASTAATGVKTATASSTARYACPSFVLNPAPAGGGGGGGGSVTPVIRSFSVGQEASGSNTVNITKPAGLQAGDYLVALSSGDADNTLTSPLATLSSAAADGTNNIPPAILSGRIATSTDAAASSFTFSSSFATGDQAIILMAIQAGTFDASNPISVGTWTRTARTSTRTQTAPTMTGVANGLLLSLFATEENAVSQTYPSSGPAGTTLVASQGSATNYALAGVYSEVLAADGATGTRVVTPTGSSTTNGWSAALAMINPAPATDDGTGFFYELAA